MLSDKALKALKPCDKRYQVADAFGLSVRVNVDGSLVFQHRYRFHGKPYRVDLGTYPVTTLAEARQRHHEHRRLLETGINPVDALRAAEESAMAAITVTDLVNEFSNLYLKKFRKNPDQAIAMLKRDITSVLGSKKVSQVSRFDVVRTLQKIVDRGSAKTANRTCSLVKQMFGFAVTRGYIELNPCSALTRTSMGGAEKPKDNYLSYIQIWVFWHALTEERFSEALKIVCKILLATGQRRGEIMLGKWDHLDKTRPIWIIPAELSKNGKAHVVHLSPFVKKQFDELRKLSRNSAYFVPSPYGQQDMPMHPDALNRALSRMRNAIGIPELTPHVLRHTFSTQCGGIAIAPHIIEKILNHTLGGMFAVYNHQHYYAERQSSLTAWSDRLELIVNSKKDELPVEPNDLDLAYQEAA